MGQRLDAYLAGASAGVSRARVQKMIADGRVSVNGAVVTKKNAIVNDGDDVIVDDGSAITDEAPWERMPEPQDIPLDVIYEDQYVAVINKPAGLVVHPGSGNHDGTVVNALLYRFGSQVSSGSEPRRPGIVHRLDKDTSGALLIAKSDAAHAAFADLFSSRRIHKVYTGFCVGARPLEHEVMELPLARSRRDPKKRAVDLRNGDQSVTEYKLITHICGISLMEFILHTGRTHQIRVHCSHRGFPIVKDDLYGGEQSKVQKIPPMERPFAYGIFKCFNRQALHARSLRFVHPFTGKDTEIIAEYPADFRSAMGAIIK